MSEPEIIQRYDIIEGVRYFMPGATWQHQRILRHIASLLEQYEVNTGKGFTLAAPLDVLIRRAPLLQTRQPDVFFITVERLAEGGGVPQRGPLTIGPELVVEIVSDSERAQMLAGKLADYASIGVIEAWVVRPPTKTVEVILLSGDGIASKFTDSEELRSHIFADLSLQVADFFKP
jgi:Uma2 family endonuclease